MRGDKVIEKVDARCKNLCLIDCVYSLHCHGVYIYTLSKSVTTRHD